MMKRRVIGIIVIFICIFFIIIKLNILSNKNNNPNNSNKLIRENQQSITDNKTEEDVLLDSFYDESFTTNYKDIRKLDENYNIDDAKKDHCFVVGAMVYNEKLYSEFMNNYNNRKNAFIRIVQNTVEGDAIIYDVKFDSKQNKLYVVADDTRDKFSADNHKGITIKEYENIIEYEIADNLYWVVYNGELNESTFDSDNVFVLVLIN